MDEKLDIVETVSGNEYTILYIDYQAALREIERLRGVTLETTDILEATLNGK